MKCAFHVTSAADRRCTFEFVSVLETHETVHVDAVVLVREFLNLIVGPRARKMEQRGFRELTLFVFVLLVPFGVAGEFESSWTMYKEQPCCSGGGSHHVRHHRGRVPLSSAILQWRESVAASSDEPNYCNLQRKFNVTGF